jgi:release factor glutamine methyltransferase
VLTIKQVLKSASVMLADCSDTAKLDAQVILAHVLEKDLTYLITWSDKVLSSQDNQTFEALLQRRLNGEPVAYVVGHKEFWSLPLAVAPSTLIPRPDTETIVELVLEQHQTPNLHVLDLGTGTGAIALALANENPTWKVTAVDCNDEAVKLAQGNAKRLEINNVTVLQSDWFNSLPKQQFNVIVSNPPYIDEQDEHLAQGDVRFEPKSALVASENGLADIRHIIDLGRTYLTKQGSMYIEHGYKQGQAVRQLFDKMGYSQVKTEQDLGGNDRITFAVYAD